MSFKLNVYKTPWGLCVPADDLVRNLETSLSILIQHVGPQMHVGTFGGVHMAFIEVDALPLIPGCVPCVPGPEGVSGIEGVGGNSGDA